MKKIAITMRAVNASEYVERRDALDQRWIDLLLNCNLWPVLIPNNVEYAKKFVQKECPDGLLLTGGSDLSEYGGGAPERDDVEKVIFEHALEQNLPVLGVCRGMQFIQNYFGIKLHRVQNHVGNRFSLEINSDSKWKSVLEKFSDVNAYHSWGAYESLDQLITSAASSDGVVMAVEHSSLPVFGHMWHPERDEVLGDAQVDIFREIYGNGWYGYSRQ